jgi:hypothetical protein
MSLWHQQKEAFIWTLVDDKAYVLLRFNQSRGGVYLIDASSQPYKFSLHTDGNSHGRTSDKRHEYEEFKLPPIRDISSHCLSSQWRPIHPEVIRKTAPLISRPPTDGNSIFIGHARDLFEPYCSLVIETYIYDPEKSREIETHINSNSPHREQIELRIFKEYSLEDHAKLLGVAIYIAQVNHERAA